MIRAHSAALRFRLEQSTLLSDKTFEGVITDRPESYCAFFLQTKRLASRFSAGQTSALFSVTTHSIGSTIEQAQLIQEQVIEQLLGHALTVTGRSCHRMKHEVSRLPVLDEDPNPSLWLIADQFDFLSEPAEPAPGGNA